MDRVSSSLRSFLMRSISKAPAKLEEIGLIA
jgi:hypothetical protein